MSTREPAGSGEWWTRPSVVLPLVATVALLVALLTPQASSGRFGDPRLSTHLSGSLGARVLAELAQRLGWTVEKRDSIAAPESGDGRTIHAVLHAATPITPREAHRYLEAVRAGDALLLVLGDRTPLSDSLGVAHHARGGVLPRYQPAAGECRGRRDLAPPLWADNRVHLYGLRWLRAAPAPLVSFAPLEPDDIGPRTPGDAASGFAYGSGRIVVVADPDLLRNDVLRHCPWGADVVAVRILEWLRAGGDAPRVVLAFDEYHQGFGARPSLTGVTGRFLVGHPVGRAVLAAAAAGVLLLLAVAPRPLVPGDVERIERRDPLEQVDALAHAYEQVRATRTVVQRLVRGMRWRVERGVAARSRGDDDFLHAAGVRWPGLAADVATIHAALEAPVPERDLPQVGAALRRVEHTLTTHPP